MLAKALLRRVFVVIVLLPSLITLTSYAEKASPPASSRSGTAGKKPKVSGQAPWIADGKPGFFSPIETLGASKVTGLVHGVKTEAGWMEQWFLSNSDIMNPVNGYTISKYPPFLPIAESAYSGKLVWVIGAYPNTDPSPVMKWNQFYDWALNKLDVGSHSYTYGFGWADSHDGYPPPKLIEGLNGNAIDSDTDGYAEVVTYGECKISAFAANIVILTDEDRKKPIYAGLDRTRRIVEAWYSDKCKALVDSNILGPTTATSTTVSPVKYGEWQKDITQWPGNVSYSDGTIRLINQVKSTKLDKKAFELHLPPALRSIK